MVNMELISLDLSRLKTYTMSAILHFRLIKNKVSFYVINFV